MFTFWDFALLRLHFGFGVVPGGLAWMTQALTAAYVPLSRRMFSAYPPGPALPVPILTPFSIWLLTRDCPAGTLLRHDADHRLNDLMAPPPPLRLDVTPFPGQLTAAGPVDAGPHLSVARRTPPPSPADEAAAMQAVGPDCRQRMTDFRSRVRLAAPVTLFEQTLTDFVGLWRQYAEGNHDPARFSHAWFFHDVIQLLEGWPAHPPRVWDARPVWIDPHEWPFLRCCYQVLRPVDRLALFLLLYGGLNIRQVNRLLGHLHNQTGWRWGEGPAGLEGAMSHLVARWAAVIDCLVEARRKRVTAN